MGRNRAGAVLTLGAAILLTWLPGGAAQTGDPPAGAVIASSQAGAPEKILPPADGAAKLQPIASSLTSETPGTNRRPGERLPAFRRVDLPPSEAPWQPAEVRGQPVAESAGELPRGTMVALEKVPHGSKAGAYEIVVRNIGGTPALHVCVRDRLPAGARFVSSQPVAEVQGESLVWKLGTLDKGATTRLQVETQITGGLVLAGATVTFAAPPDRTDPEPKEPPVAQAPPVAQGPILPPVVPLASAPTLQAPPPVPLAPSPAPLAKTVPTLTPPAPPPTPVASTPAPAPSAPAAPLSLIVQAPDRVGLGETVPFTLVVTNGGAAPVANVTVRDRLPAGLEHPEGDFLESDLGTLAPGETKKLDLKVRAVKAGPLVNQAQALTRDGVQANVSTTVVVDEPTLVIRQAGPERPLLGRPSDYRLEVVNRAGRDAREVQFQAQLPPGLDFLTADGGGAFDPPSRTVRWALGAIPAGMQQAVTLRVVPRQPGLLVSQLLARSAEGQEVRLQTPLQVQSTRPVQAEVRVVGPQDVLTVGKELVYEVHVANPGNSPLTGVQVAALLPAGVTPRRGDGPTAARVQGQEVVFAPLPSLAPRARVVYRIRMAGNRTGVGRMRVRVTAGTGDAPLFRDFNVMVVRLETPAADRA